MKLIHLADLHLGRRYETIELEDDQRAVLAEITELIRREDPRPDAVMIAGDVYDRSVPPEWAVRLLNGFLNELSQICPVLVISGNHDSGERISFLSDVLSRQNIHMAGTAAQSLKPVTIGDTDFWLMPYLDPVEVNRCLGTSAHTMEQGVQALLAHREPGHARHQVLIGHFFAAGNGVAPEISDSERNPIGGEYAVDVNVIKDFDYVALGHLHGAQQVGGLRHVRYAGSPLMYSFSEERQSKSITVVELGEDEPVIRRLPLTAGRRMHTLQGTLEELLSRRPDPRVQADFYLFKLLDDHIIQNAESRLHNLYDNVKLNYVRLDMDKIIPGGGKVPGLNDIRGKDELQLLTDFFEKQLNEPLSGEDMQILAHMMEEIRKDS